MPDQYRTTSTSAQTFEVEWLDDEGILVGRDLKDEKGYAYEIVFLVSENKKFLEDYPRKNLIAGKLAITVNSLVKGFSKYLFL